MTGDEGDGPRQDTRVLRDALERLDFPAELDHVLVELVRDHVPAHIVDRVRALSPIGPYRTVDDLCADLEGYPPPRAAPPWG